MGTCMRVCARACMRTVHDLEWGDTYIHTSYTTGCDTIHTRGWVEFFSCMWVVRSGSMARVCTTCMLRMGFCVPHPCATVV